MSAVFVGLLEGVITIKISGKLTQPELAEVQKSAGELIQQQGRGRFLILVENFQGTAPEGNWGDLSFQARFDSLIEKIAIVGDKPLEELALLFTAKGIRPVPVEYFQPSEMGRARVWLTGGT